MSESSILKKDKPKLSLKENLNIIKDNRFFIMLMPIVILLLVFVIFGILVGSRFFTKNIMIGILNQAMIIATMATGISFIYTTGNLDISVGAVMALAATLGALVYNATSSIALMVVVSITAGVALMVFNCTLSAIFNIRTMTVAIVAMQIYSAIVNKILGASNLVVPYKITRQLEDGGFRYIAFAIFLIIAIVVFHYTKVGRVIRFIGGNERCAEQTGITPRKYIFISFIMAGLGVGLAAVFTIIRTGVISVTTGSGMGMDVMLATVLGGMSIFEGARSNSYSGVTGSLTVAALNKGLIMAGVSTTILQGIRGVIFLALVYLTSERLSTLPKRNEF